MEAARCALATALWRLADCLSFLFLTHFSQLFFKHNMILARRLSSAHILGLEICSLRMRFTRPLELAGGLASETSLLASTTLSSSTLSPH